MSESANTEFITLTVTQPVLRQVAEKGESQRQIAIQGASAEILQRLRETRRENPLRILIGGVFPLTVGDTVAIWFSHQTEGEEREDFISLYNLLARHPGCPVKFSRA